MEMTEEIVEEILRGINCLRTGHFVVHGFHFEEYVDIKALLANERALDNLARGLAERVVSAGLDVAVVTGPGAEGVVLAQWVARHLTSLTGNEMEVASNQQVSAYRFDCGADDSHALRNGGVLVVSVSDDTEGEMLGNLLDLIDESGGHAVAVACIIDQCELTQESLGVPTFLRLIRRPIEAFDPNFSDGCPFCLRNLPIDLTIGSGKVKKR